MRIRKAVITAAGGNQRALPLQTLIHDGAEKSVLSILIEQALTANIGEICVVVWPGDEGALRASRRQPGGRRALRPPAAPTAGIRPRHLLCARICGSGTLPAHGGRPPVRQRREARRRSAWWSWRKPSRAPPPAFSPRAKACSPGLVPWRDAACPAGTGVYRVETVIEKPTPTEAEQRLMVPGIRAGYYLCFFGIHVFTPTLMDLLGRMLESEPNRALTLSAALAELARQEQYLALEDTGRRYDLGARYGLLTAQLALALNGRDRDEVLTHLLELLAEREMTSGR